MKKRYWQSFNSINAWSDLREAKGAMPPELGLNKSGASSGATGIQENLLAAGAPPWTPLGELASLLKNPTPALCPLSLWLRPFAPHPLDEIGNGNGRPLPT